MPSERRHLEAAATNQDFSGELLVARRLDWAVVVAFYSALHWADAFLARQGIHPTDHSNRDLYIRRTQLRRIHTAYRDMRELADEARYDLLPMTLGLVEHHIGANLAAIRRHVESMLE
jgi:uncharacterized protein (UPF0332 family)